MPHGIYPDDLAEALQARAGRKWRPSNGTEGSIFIDSWCGRCSRDANEDCPILAAAFAYDVDDDEYPKEWNIGKDGQPQCSAWLDPADPPKERCPHTGDLPFNTGETTT